MATISATFEQGTFRPLSPVDLPEGAQVEISIVPVAASGKSTQSQSLSIEEQLRAISATVPAEEWARLPADLSDRLDQHIYDVGPK